MSICECLSEDWELKAKAEILKEESKRRKGKIFTSTALWFNFGETIEETTETSFASEPKFDTCHTENLSSNKFPAPAT